MRWVSVFALLLACSDSFGQSFGVSGGRQSIISSGHVAATWHKVNEIEKKVDKLQDDVSRIDRNVTTLMAQKESGTAAKPQEVKPVIVQPARQRYLVSESWCPHCPAAKARFKSRGWPEKNIITMDECQQRFGFRPAYVPYEFDEPEKVVTQSPVVTTQPRYYQYGGSVYDLETYGGCSSSRCGMCAQIRAAQQRYRQSLKVKTITIGPQANTPDETIDRAIDALMLDESSVLGDLGCGDGRVLIRAAQKTGCRGIGVEIDPEMAEQARRSVADAGLSHTIQIVTGDAVDFDVIGNGITALYSYLYPDLLEKLADKFRQVGVGVSPFHDVPGLQMAQSGDVWVYRR